MSISAIETLWREYLQAYGEPQVRAELHCRWGGDANLTQGRIQFDYPPTFQPGYVGPAYYEADARILFLGYNPGEGKLQSSQDEDKSLALELQAFANGQASLAQFNQLLSEVRRANGERGIWQRRFWEHTIRDDRDYAAHMDYISFNPVKHGWVERVVDWPYSSFHRHVRAGVYPVDWGGGVEVEGVFGERGGD